MNSLIRLLALPLVLAVTLAGSSSAAPKKALFDNAHAETAGNADWQIDTDQPVPVPDQAAITQATLRSYWLGGISSWAVDLVKRGYQVATRTGALSYGNQADPYDLSNWDVFIVCEPNTKFTSSDSAAIFDFVREGGGLVMVVDHDNSDRNMDGFDSPKIWNLLDAQLLTGIHAQSAGETNRNITQDSGNVETAPSDSIIHGPNGVADSLSFHNGTTFVLHPETNSRVRGLVWMNTMPHDNSAVMAARSEYGNGRIVIVGDSSPADDGSAAPGNSSIFDGWGEASGRDSLFFQNATQWATRRDVPLVSVPGGTRPGLAFLPLAPNPGSGSITLRFTLPNAARVKLEFLDALGRRTRSLGSRDFSAAGTHSWTWDGLADDSRRAAPGIYTARLVTPFGTITQRVVRVR